MKRWTQGIFLCLGVSGAALQTSGALFAKTLSFKQIRQPFQLHFLNSPYNNYFLENQTQPLLNVFSEPEDWQIHNLFVSVDQNQNLLALIRKTGAEQQIIPQEELFRKETSLARASGRDAIFVRCKGSKETGGRIIIKYLYDGILKKYREMEGELRKNSAGKWQMYTLKKVPVQKLTLKSRKLFGRLIGIDRIDVN